MLQKIMHGMALALLALGTAVPAMAAVQWTMSGSDGCADGCGGTPGNTRPFVAGGVTLNANAWSNTAGATNAQLESAYLGLYSGGLGVKNKDGAAAAGDTNEWIAPEHAADNEGRIDSILMSFSQAVKLTDVTIGFHAVDSDITLLAYTGANPFNPATTLSGMTYAGLTGAGWTIVGNYTNLADNVPRAVNAGGISSSYWLVGPYNSVVNNDPGCTITCTNDYVKILAVSAATPTTQQVSEPSSLMLLGMAAVVGLWRSRRRGVCTR